MGHLIVTGIGLITVIIGIYTLITINKHSNHAKH
jgi:hypothetical protein